MWKSSEMWIKLFWNLLVKAKYLILHCKSRVCYSLCWVCIICVCESPRSQLKRFAKDFRGNKGFVPNHYSRTHSAGLKDCWQESRLTFRFGLTCAITTSANRLVNVLLILLSCAPELLCHGFWSSSKCLNYINDILNPFMMCFETDYNYVCLMISGVVNPLLLMQTIMLCGHNSIRLVLCSYGIEAMDE